MRHYLRDLIRLAFLIQYRSVTDRHTDKQTHTRRRRTALAYSVVR